MACRITDADYRRAGARPIRNWGLAAMFKYFPGNYPWNLAVDLAIEMGARIGEIEAMCGPLAGGREAARCRRRRRFSGELGPTWRDKLCALAQEDEARGRLISAGDKYGRAATYYLTAERLQGARRPGRAALYRRFLDVFARGVRPGGRKLRARRNPLWRQAHLAALYVRAEGVDGRAPLLVQVNGLDSTKEMKYRVGLPRWLARRGVSSLIVDQPGTGEALRLHGLHAVYNSEIWASQVVDWLETRDDVDPSASAWKAFRSAATSARARWHSSRGSPAASSGAPTTTGATCRRSACRARAISRAALLGACPLGLGRPGHG